MAQSSSMRAPASRREAESDGERRVDEESDPWLVLLGPLALLLTVVLLSWLSTLSS